jgi:hypothetical protein
LTLLATRADLLLDISLGHAADGSFQEVASALISKQTFPRGGMRIWRGLKHLPRQARRQGTKHLRGFTLFNSSARVTRAVTCL